MIISQPIPDEVPWGTLIRNFGVPGSMLAVLIVALVKGWLITQREAKEQSADCAAREKLLQERHAVETALLRDRFDALRAEATTRLEALTVEKNMWRDTALKGLKLAEVATDKVTKA
jgi:hypothetical protein